MRTVSEKTRRKQEARRERRKERAELRLRYAPNKPEPRDDLYPEPPARLPVHCLE